MRENEKDYSCTTIDLSLESVSIATKEMVNAGEWIVAYIHSLGRIEGSVVRSFPGGFVMMLTLTPKKKEILANKITWIAVHQALGTLENRRHERIKTHRVLTTLRLPSGREVVSKIRDVSRSGVSLSVFADFVPEIGASVIVGDTKGRIVRVFEHGVAVEFDSIIPNDVFGEDLIL